LGTVGLDDVFAVVGGAVLPHEGPSGSIGERALPLPKNPELVPQPDRLTTIARTRGTPWRLALQPWDEPVEQFDVVAP